MTPTEFAIKLGMEGDTMNSEHDHSNFLRENVLEAATQPALIDDPETDGTDFAHPAWWRGQDHALEMICHHVNLILDGKDDGKGENLEGPWRELRRRLLALVKTQPAQDVAALVDRAKQATAILRLPERLNIAKYEVTPTQAGDWAYLIELLATALLAADAARVRAEMERDFAIAHDRQPYPTAWAYDRLAKANIKHIAERDALAAKLAEAEENASNLHLTYRKASEDGFAAVRAILRLDDKENLQSACYRIMGELDALSERLRKAININEKGQ